MFGLGIQEVVIILVVALLIIGPKKLPDLARSLGKALREFKGAADDFKQNIDINPSELTPRTNINQTHQPPQKETIETEAVTDPQPETEPNIEAEAEIDPEIKEKTTDSGPINKDS